MYIYICIYTTIVNSVYLSLCNSIKKHVQMEWQPKYESILKVILGQKSNTKMTENRNCMNAFIFNGFYYQNIQKTSTLICSLLPKLSVLFIFFACIFFSL